MTRHLGGSAKWWAGHPRYARERTFHSRPGASSHSESMQRGEHYLVSQPESSGWSMTAEVWGWPPRSGAEAQPGRQVPSIREASETHAPSNTNLHPDNARGTSIG